MRDFQVELLSMAEIEADGDDNTRVLHIQGSSSRLYRCVESMECRGAWEEFFGEEPTYDRPLAFPPRRIVMVPYGASSEGSSVRFLEIDHDAVDSGDDA